MTSEPNLNDVKLALESIRWAQDRLRDRTHRTPLATCSAVSTAARSDLLLKCESFQRGGSFKIRGALTKATSLDPTARERGLITHSSGNHAQGVALAARLVGTSAVVVMPEDASEVKVTATRAYGAEVVFCGHSNEQRRDRALALADERGLTMVPPFDDPWIICGQATVAAEIVAERPDVAVIFAPIGGGGLLAGTAIGTAALSPKTAVVGVEPTGCAKMTSSRAAGHRVEVSTIDTIADGLRPAAVGECNYEVIERWVGDIVTVSDDQIRAAMTLLWQRAKLVVEPSGAVALAGAIEHARAFAGPVAVIVSGGNVDLARLPVLLT